MNYSHLIFAGAIALIVAGCAGQPWNAKKSAADSDLNRPIPASDEARREECAWLRGEIARQQGLTSYAGSVMTTSQQDVQIRASAQRNIAALESRAAKIQCVAVDNDASRPAASALPTATDVERPKP